MRIVLLVSILLLPLNVAVAVNLGPIAEPKPAPGDPYAGGGRVGGDTFEDATVITAIPFSDSGNTCGYANDYDAVCPYASSSSPDVVYVYEPTYDTSVRVDLCTSGYDTKVYVCVDDPDNIIACNDDFPCGVDGYRSRIDNLYLAAGQTFYIVVDGYGGLCGAYDLAIHPVPVPPCLVGCPPNAQQEGEPPCVDGYEDSYNPGCSGSGGWTPIEPQSDSTGVMCGRACTYLSQGMQYRDTDWCTAVAAGGPTTVTGRAAFPPLFLIIFGLECAQLEYVYGTGAACEPVTLSWTFAPDQEFWVWAGPTQFSGVPESDYVLEVTGIRPSAAIGACCFLDGSCQIQPQASCLALAGVWYGAGTACVPSPCPDPTPVERTSWGRIKNAFR